MAGADCVMYGQLRLAACKLTVEMCRFATEGVWQLRRLLYVPMGLVSIANERTAKCCGSSASPLH